MKTRVKIEMEVIHDMEHEHGEDVTQRLGDIYLWGAGPQGFQDKEDVGGDIKITVLEEDIQYETQWLDKLFEKGDTNV